MLVKLNLHIITLKDQAIKSIKDQALSMNATKIIGLQIEFTELSGNNNASMLVVSVYGTAIKPIPNGGTQKKKKK